jgi:hypothetical protein
MAYSFHRIFCATPGALEEERQAFYDVMGQFNETHAMPRGILLVCVSFLPNVSDKRSFQHAVNDNIRACRYYIQLLEDTWGTPEKHFGRDYALAVECAADPNMPMQEVAILYKKPFDDDLVDARVAAFRKEHPAPEFEKLDQFKSLLHGLLERWLETMTPTTVAAAPHSAAG